MGVEGTALSLSFPSLWSAFVPVPSDEKKPGGYTVSLRDVRLDSYYLRNRSYQRSSCIQIP